MARPQGAGTLADLTACEAVGPNCSKVRPSISIQQSIHLRWSWTQNLRLTKHLIPYSFSFVFISFLSIQVSGISGQEETPQWARRCLRETPLYPHGFFLFPVCAVGESFSTSSENGAAATRPHCLLHTDLILQLLWDLLYCYYSLPCFFWCMRSSCVFSVLFLLFNKQPLWMEARQVYYLSVVSHNDQLNVFGCLLSVPFMLK